VIHIDGMLSLLFLWFSTDWKIGLYCGIGVYCGLFECWLAVKLFGLWRSWRCTLMVLEGTN